MVSLYIFFVIFKLDDHAQSDDINMKSIMQDLKGAIEKLLQFFLHCDFLPLGSTEVLTKTTQEVTGLDGICPVQNTGPSSELLRLFVVVMDYDPLSLCITGQPERELTLQSGMCITLCTLVEFCFTMIIQSFVSVSPGL